jgi:hypothetical protein
VYVAGVLSGHYPIGEQFTCFLEPTDSRQKLAKLEISRHVAGIFFQKLLKILDGCRVITQLGALESQAVSRERVGGFFCYKFLQNFPARLLCLGHGLNARIITSLRTRAKL